MHRLALAAAAILAALSPAAAQSSGPSTLDSGSHGSSLSSKLSKSNGVITPKADIDPGIHAQAPDPHPNSTPVVPPAAAGGGTAK